jgi:antitoxin Xre/MbcA/ParS-like protein
MRSDWDQRFDQVACPLTSSRGQGTDEEMMRTISIMISNEDFEWRSGNPRSSGADFSNPEMRRALSPAAIRSFFNIAHEWGVGERQMSSLLCGIPFPILDAWKRNAVEPVLDRDTLTRISLILGIYNALHTYFGEVGDYWITHPNDSSLFGGAIPIDYMMAGLEGMYEVRRMLDGWTMGH